MVAFPIPMAGETDDPDTAPHEAGTNPVARVHAAWRSWLSALASDSEAAIAAALAYESLPPEARDAWLDALDADGPSIDVPAVALYAPLLAVEGAGPRRQRIEARIASEPPPAHPSRPGRRHGAWALRGVAGDGAHVCVLVVPVYLEFVHVIVCRYTPTGGFIAVRHDPLRHAGDVLRLPEAQEVDGVKVESTPLRVVIEELAHAILADRREHRQTPPALSSVAHLFGPQLDDIAPADDDP
jgi:hypothetical protein